MGLYKYSIEIPDEKKAARAQVHDVNASYKDLSQVLGAIKGKSVKEAGQILENCISMKKAIPFKKFAKHLGHRSELGGKKGKYPKKEAKIALQLLKNAVANGDSKGLEKESLYVYGAAAYKQNVFMRHKKYWASGIVIGYGKNAFASKYVTCWAELTLLERPASKERKEEKPKLEEKKAEEVKKSKGPELAVKEKEEKNEAVISGK